VKIRIESKLQALEMLAKHLGLLTESQDVNTSITIQWLPPEPPPDLPEPKRVEGHRVPFEPGEVIEAEPSRQDKMGFWRGPPGPSHRTQPQIFSDSIEDLNAEVGSSGISLRAQRRMFPELRPPGVRMKGRRS
jgi:hypothetical protein